MAQTIDFSVTQQEVDFDIESTISTSNIITVNVYLDDELQETTSINGYENNTINITFD